MKMGTIASPWRDDDAAENATEATLMHRGHPMRLVGLLLISTAR
jgi:hypothetical protein